ncbi:MAG: hypothetical protein V4684_13835 [Pseudomonadota bacterium]
MKILLAAVAVAAAWPPVAAQTIYRCGDSYSQTPCEGATILQPDRRQASPRDVQAARAATLRDARLAAAMEKDRLKAEAMPPSILILPVRGRPSTPSSSEKKVVMSRPDKLHAFTAHAPAKPGSEKTKSKKKKPKAG